MKSPGLLDIAGAKNMMSQIRAFTLYPALSDSSLIGWVHGATTINPTRTYVVDAAAARPHRRGHPGPGAGDQAGPE